MSAIAVPHHRPHLPVRALALSFLALLAVVGVAAVAARIGDDPDGAVTATVATTSATEAIESWLVDNRAEVFPGAAGRYLGTCPDDAPGFTVGLCSRLVEDLGDTQVHLVGAYATDWGADLLLVRTPSGWTVGGVSSWPELGTRYDGPPWSPVSAIAGWWFDRAAARYGAGAVHLRSCADADAIDTGQPLVCSVLVEDGGDVRVYESGLVGQPADVRLIVTVRADHTWLVTAEEEIPTNRLLR